MTSNSGLTLTRAAKMLTTIYCLTRRAFIVAGYLPARVAATNAWANTSLVIVCTVN